MQPITPPKDTLEARFFWFKKLRVMILFSLIINLLYLTGPIFMMQVYDRVLASANVSTLVGLGLITLLLYLFFGCLEFIRNQALKAHGEIIAGSFNESAYQTAVLNNCEKAPSTEKRSAVADVSILRQFLTSPTFASIFDLPWAPIFFLFIFGLHPTLGVAAIIAGIILSILAFINERLSRAQLKRASSLTAQTSQYVQYAQRNAVTLKGNGMIGDVGKNWLNADTEARKIGLQGGKINAYFATTTKTLRLALQSLMLGLGAYLVLQGEMTPGGIIACTVVFGRALAPLEQILGAYSSLVGALDSWNNIKTWLFDCVNTEEKSELPPPEKSLSVHNLAISPPHDKSIFLVKNTQFDIEAGEVLGITGHSGSGKSTLAKALVSSWPVALGKICLDGAELNQWHNRQLGKYIGYLPQLIELGEGSIAQNIARFSDQADFNKVLEASKMAGTHQLILDLEDGYDTLIGGESGRTLSAGQTQRIALARAIYGSPFLVVLDEPDSNLDAEGEKLLRAAIKSLKDRGAIVVFVSHRPQMLDLADKLLVMHKGEMKAFGTPQAIVEQSKKMAALQAGANK